MKEYMMIFLGAEYSTPDVSPEEMQNRMKKWFVWDQKMKDAGIYVSGEALTPQVRHVSGPDRTVTDRAGSEIKELVGGFYVVRANNMDEMVDIASDYPDYDLGGTVEIREIMVFDQ